MGKSTINVIFNSYVSLPEGIYLHVILLYYVSFISSNVNPGLANPGWLIVVVPPNFVISMATEMVPPQQPRLLGVDSSGFDKKYPSLDFPKTYPVPWTSENVPGFQDFSKTLSSSLCPAFGTGRDLGIRGRLSKVTTFGSLGSQIKYNLDMIYNPRSNIIYRLYIYIDQIYVDMYHIYY